MSLTVKQYLDSYPFTSLDQVLPYWSYYECKKSSLLYKTKKHYTKVKWFYEYVLSDFEYKDQVLISFQNFTVEECLRFKLADHIYFSLADQKGYDVCIRPTSRSSDGLYCILELQGPTCADVVTFKEFNWTDMKNKIIKDDSLRDSILSFLLGKFEYQDAEKIQKQIMDYVERRAEDVCKG